MRALTVAALLAVAQSAHGQPSALDQKLREVRYDLRIDNDKFQGKAAPVLETAIAGAQYVLIGEDHITREIPRFATAVCDAMAPLGLSAMAVEVGPQVANLVASSFGKPDRLARMAELTRQYPESVAFLNVRQENDLAAHCAQVSRNPDFRLWGLDQEFLGSAGWLLDQILATHPGPAATAALTRLKEEEQHGALQAKETGDPSKLFLFAASDSELGQSTALVEREGNAVAKTLLREIVESHEIYLKNAQGSPDSNAQRARLLKQNLSQDLAAAAKGGELKKVLVKFGDWHLYKGFNPLQQRDLGNYIAELAEGQGSASLHICVLGAKGTHFTYGGYARPGKLEKFVLDEDDEYRWLKPAIDNQLPDAWTLYDLRKLRFQKLGPLDPEMKRLIYGYDLLVIIPELSPADPIK